MPINFTGRPVGSYGNPTPVCVACTSNRTATISPSAIVSITVTCVSGRALRRLRKNTLNCSGPRTSVFGASEAETHSIGCMQFVNRRFTTFIPHFLEPAVYQSFVRIVCHGRTLYHRRKRRQAFCSTTPQIVYSCLNDSGIASVGLNTHRATGQNCSNAILQ